MCIKLSAKNNLFIHSFFLSLSLAVKYKKCDNNKGATRDLVDGYEMMMMMKRGCARGIFCYDVDCYTTPACIA